MRIFIIGASGLVGGNCLNHLRRDPGHEVVGTHYTFASNETVYFNVFNSSAGTFDPDTFRPDIIIHTGALTHVDYCETHPDESYRNTVESTAAVIDIARRNDASLIYISSDYVFDGKNGPYAESDAVNPLSVYGRHKLQAENMIRETVPEHLILRVTNVYGDEIRGKNFVSFLIREAQSGEEKIIKLPSDQFATPINAMDIARACAELIGERKRGLYHLASYDYLSRVELARKVLSHFPDAKVSIKALPTSALGQAAPRPLKGGLKNDKFLAEFPEFRFSTIDDYMREKHGI